MALPAPVRPHAPGRGALAYQTVNAQSSSPLGLVVMLYDGALRFLGQAREAQRTGDALAAATAISRTLAIVAELQRTLDVERGGAVGEHLDQLYDYITFRLVDVTTKRDVGALAEAEKLMRPLRDAFAEAASAPRPA